MDQFNSEVQSYFKGERQFPAQSDNTQPQQSDNGQPTDTNNNQQDQQPAQNLADNQVVGSNGEVIDLGRTSEESINK